MNCALCSNYIALKNDVRTKGLKLPYCKGCKPRNKKGFFIKKNYVTLYHTIMVENLSFIKKHGLDKFLENQNRNGTVQIVTP